MDLDYFGLYFGFGYYWQHLKLTKNECRRTCIVFQFYALLDYIRLPDNQGKEQEANSNNQPYNPHNL